MANLTEQQRDNRRLAKRKWRLANSDKQQALSAAWRVANRDRYNGLIRAWRERQKSNPRWIAEQRCRNRLHKLIKRRSHVWSTRDLIGCSPAELVRYLEAQFVEGMSWGNRELWHIDHIKPCASFDLTNPDEQKKCFHYTNLRPRWATENQAESWAIRKRYGRYGSC